MKHITLSNQTLSEQVYNYIKRTILSGELKGGEKVSEEKAANQFGVSRTPVREALKRLEEYGLIVIKPRSYAVVKTIEPKEAQQIAYIRAQLETLSVRLLAECGTEEDFNELEIIAQECDELISQGDVAATFEKDSNLHLEIAKRSGSYHLYDIFERFDAKVQLSRLVFHLPLKRLTFFVNQHHEILNAMRRHDQYLSEALMKHHVLHQLDYY